MVNKGRKRSFAPAIGRACSLRKNMESNPYRFRLFQLVDLGIRRKRGINTPVTVMETAGEGGAWGIAILAMFMENKAENETLPTYLADYVFAGQKGTTLAPDAADVEGYEVFIDRYTKGLSIERAAVDSLV